MTDDRYDPLSMDNYKLLIDWLNSTHDRWDALFRTLLAIHGGIFAGIIFILTKDINGGKLLATLLPIIGIILCFKGYFALERIWHDSQLRCHQLREFECGNPRTNQLNMFTYGYKFFHKKLDEKEYKEIIDQKTGENDKYGEDKNNEYAKQIVGFSQKDFVKQISCLLGIVYSIFLLTTLYNLFWVKCVTSCL